MKIFILCFCTVIVIVLLLLFVKVRIKIEYNYVGKNDALNITFFVAFIKVFSYNSPIIHADKKETMTNETVVKKGKKLFVREVRSFYSIVKRFLANVSIHDFTWKTAIGVGDAAHTAILSGGLWSLKGSVLGLLSRLVKLKQRPYLEVIPRFHDTYFKTFFSCMITFRIGHAIIAGLLLAKHQKRRLKSSSIHTMKEHHTT